jgi:mRNA-degrading endonuclease RelE of RelBE toxin-antitoxin system
MELVFSDAAKKELAHLSQDMKAVFLMHLEKMKSRPSRKQMNHGIECHGEKVTKQARIIYDSSEDRTCILHCFASHKEYEHWYKSYK